MSDDQLLTFWVQAEKYVMANFPQEIHIVYLDSLPMIGPITKYHLARNIGLDYAKPDRHLIRLAEKFGYPDIQVMCTKLSAYSGWRIGTVDVILWRYCNMQSSCSRGHQVWLRGR